MVLRKREQASSSSQRKAEFPLVAILATGGTVAGQANRPGSVAEYTPGVLTGAELLHAVAGLECVARLRCRQVANVGSEDMVDSVWKTLSAMVREEMADADVSGVVVLHGTDTMEETAVFLDVCLKTGVLGASIRKPLVMTGAMRPADAVSADGPTNILSAVQVAVAQESSGRGVIVVFNGRIHAASRVYKQDSIHLDAFASVGNTEAGAVVDGKVRYFHSASSDALNVNFSLEEALPKVEVIFGHAGQGRTMTDAALAGGAWGVVHAGVGMGNIHCDVRGVLAEAAAGGVIVVRASRVCEGMVVRTERDRRDRFVAAGSLNPQKARVLLQLCLVAGLDEKGTQRIFDAYQ